MPTIYLVRHGESEMNVVPQLSHRLADLPLTERGHQQARLLAARLGEHRLVHIVTSPLRRARQTADYIAERTGAPVQESDALREINSGILDGRGDAEAWAITREVFGRWNRGERDVAAPGGESHRQLCERLIGVVQELMQTFPRDDVAIVGHGGLFWFALPAVCGFPPESRTELLNTSVTVLRHQDGEITCDLWGCITHLGPETAPRSHRA